MDDKRSEICIASTRSKRGRSFKRESGAGWGRPFVSSIPRDHAGVKVTPPILEMLERLIETFFKDLAYKIEQS
jgi:hypothetical protein